jgi:hypothetical protein
MTQIVGESHDLWTISACYSEDAEKNSELSQLWEKIKTEKEQNIQKLFSLLKKMLLETPANQAD